MIGTTAAIIAGAMAAGGAVGAANQQQQSGQAALDFARQMNLQSQGNLQPYMQTGAAASGTLRGLMGLGSGNMGLAGDLPPGARATGPGYAYNPMTGGVTITDLGTSVFAPGGPYGQAALMGRYGTGAATVSLQAPDGSV